MLIQGEEQNLSITDHGFDSLLVRNDPNAITQPPTPEIVNVISGGVAPKNLIAGEALEFLDTGQAGVSGIGSASSSVRLWAGDTFANRATADFRVTQDGTLTASGANITGDITAEVLTVENIEYTKFVFRSMFESIDGWQQTIDLGGGNLGAISSSISQAMLTSTDLSTKKTELT